MDQSAKVCSVKAALYTFSNAKQSKNKAVHNVGLGQHYCKGLFQGRVNKPTSFNPWAYKAGL